MMEVIVLVKLLFESPEAYQAAHFKGLDKEESDQSNQGYETLPQGK
jgi:hypothetical protein